MIDLYKASVLVSMITTVIPYFSYSWAFKYPNSFLKYFTQVQLIHFAQFMKLFTVMTSAPTLFYVGINKSGVVIGLILIFVGQYLNELVYSIIGDAGVYYGLELQVVKPRKIGGFPFNIHDPMYKGTILTVMGGMFCFNMSKEFILLLATWFISYFGMDIVENTESAIDMPSKVN